MTSDRQAQVQQFTTPSCITYQCTRPHLAVGIGIQAAKHGHRVLFDSATGWVARLQEAHSRGKLAAELARLRRYSVLIMDLCRARDYAEAIRARHRSSYADIRIA